MIFCTVAAYAVKSDTRSHPEAYSMLDGAIVGSADR